jgi:hypothetical protein
MVTLAVVNGQTSDAAPGSCAVDSDGRDKASGAAPRALVQAFRLLVPTRHSLACAPTPPDPRKPRPPTTQRTPKQPRPLLLHAATPGTGAVTYRCSLPRGAPTDLKFTFGDGNPGGCGAPPAAPGSDARNQGAAVLPCLRPRAPSPHPPPRSLSSPPSPPAAACNKANSTTVTIAPPGREQITFQAAAQTHEKCPGAKGRLVFDVTPSSALTLEQVGGASSFITGPGGSKAACNGTDTTPGAGAGEKFTVECAGLEDGAYSLDISVPNNKDAGAFCWAGGPVCGGPFGFVPCFWAVHWGEPTESSASAFPRHGTAAPASSPKCALLSRPAQSARTPLCSRATP